MLTKLRRVWARFWCKRGLHQVPSMDEVRISVKANGAALHCPDCGLAAWRWYPRNLGQGLIRWEIRPRG